jgi:hypothetical protein
MVWNFIASDNAGTVSDVSGEPAFLNATFVGARQVTLAKLLRTSLRLVRAKELTRVVRPFLLAVIVSMHSSGRVRKLDFEGMI